MRKMLLALIAAGAVAAAAATPAEASSGCGPYRHRAPYGRCYSNAYYGGSRYLVERRASLRRHHYGHHYRNY